MRKLPVPERVGDNDHTGQLAKQLHRKSPARSIGMLSAIKKQIRGILPPTVLKLRKKRQENSAIKMARKTFGDGPVVNFLILGAQKCGTSALAWFLAQHPSCISTIPKETGFFSRFHDRGRDYLHAKLVYDQKKLKTAKWFFEATPEYIFYDFCPRRIFDYNPEMKMVVLLREPVSRAYSAWNMWASFRSQKLSSSIWESYGSNNPLLTAQGGRNMRQLLFGDTDNSFEYWMERELNIIESKKSNFDFPFFIRRGLYAEQIQRYWGLFPRKNLLIVESEDLKERRENVLAQVEDFLGITRYDWSHANLENRHVRSYQQGIAADTAQRLQKFYTPFNRELFQMLERDFNW